MAASSLRTLRQRTTPLRRTTDDSPPLTAADDPLGLDLQARGMENARAHMLPFGPLPDPKWAGFFQALADAGVNKLVGGPSAPGSNQLRGQSLQPYSSPGTAGDALAGVAASMPFDEPEPPPGREEPDASKGKGQLKPRDFVPFAPASSPSLGSVAALRRQTLT